MAKIKAALNKPFKNRIVGSGMVRVDELLANPLNWRIHPQFQQEALAGTIDDIGFIRSLTVNKTTGRVVDGHLRVTLAARSDVEELPVEWVELSEEEEEEALMTLDPIGAMAATDKQKMQELYALVDSEDERVRLALTQIKDREGLELIMIDDGDYSTSKGSRTRFNGHVIVVGLGRFAYPVNADLVDQVVAAVQSRFGTDPATALNDFCEWVANEGLSD